MNQDFSQYVINPNYTKQLPTKQSFVQYIYNVYVCKNNLKQ